MMTIKQSFKLFLGMLVMLIGLMGCFEGKIEVDPNSNEGNKASLQTEVTKPKIVTSKPPKFVVVAYTGFNDSGSLPKAWLERAKNTIINIVKKRTANSTQEPNVFTLFIERTDENMTIEQHADEAWQKIVNYLVYELGCDDLSEVTIIKLAESYGGLVAAQLARKNISDNLGLNIAGLVTIRTPWEGVSLVKPIPKLVQAIPQQLTLLKMALPQLSGFVDCSKTLETLDPDRSFIQGLKSNGLHQLDFPILALAGQDKEPTSPYMELMNLEETLKKMSPFLQFVVDEKTLGNFMNIVKEDVTPLLGPYKAGNDGLVLTSSAIAANSRKGANFQSRVFENFPHVGDTVKHSEALKALEGFISSIIK